MSNINGGDEVKLMASDKKIGEGLTAIIGGFLLRAIRPTTYMVEDKPSKFVDASEVAPSYDIPPYNLPIPSLEVKPYQVHQSPHGGLVVIVGNHQIGSVFDSPAYKASVEKFGEFMSTPQLKVALALEEMVRETRKHLGPRVYSGLDAHSHIVMNSDISLENAIAANVRPDYVAWLTAIAIDLAEDHPDVIKLNKEWEEAVIKFDEPGRIKKEHELRTTIHKVLSDAQVYLTKIVDNINMSGSEKRKLIEEIEYVIRLTGHNTRYSFERPYPLSMAFQFDKRTNERVAIVQERMGAKMWDRTSNNLDTGPALTYEEFQEMQRALKDDTTVGGYKVGEYVRGKYGEVRLGSYMPAAVKVGNSVHNLSIGHFLNKTLTEISEDIKPNTREEELSRWVEYSKVRMLQSALKQVRSANSWYEVILPQDVIQEINERIERKKRSNYYNAITPDGFFMKWLGYDIAGRRFIEAFDTSPQRMAEAYEVGRDLEIILSMFGMFSERGRRDDFGRPILITDLKVRFDPKKHEHFTLDGMDGPDGILSHVHGTNYRNMARRWLPEKYNARNGSHSH